MKKWSRTLKNLSRRTHGSRDAQHSNAADPIAYLRQNPYPPYPLCPAYLPSPDGMLSPERWNTRSERGGEKRKDFPGIPFLSAAAVSRTRRKSPIKTAERQQMAAHKGGIAWSGPPDPERGIYYPIKAPKPDSEVRGVILCEVVYGVLTHWVFEPDTKGKGQTLPCMGSPATCKHCEEKLEQRWKGYLSCWDHSTGRVFIAEVTREAYLRCGSFELFKGQLRGKHLRLTRAGRAGNSRVTAIVSQWQQTTVNLPPSFNVQTALERIWFGRWGGPGAEGAKPDAS